jgi:hypothetical protein
MNFWLKFYFKKIWERNCLRKFCFTLDPDPVLDPDWAKMLDPDPYKINPDPQPCPQHYFFDVSFRRFIHTQSTQNFSSAQFSGTIGFRNTISLWSKEFSVPLFLKILLFVMKSSVVDPKLFFFGSGSHFP